ncbi:MAG: hypothetical protein Pg6C_14090 [Treponemataceae bacterium]|nr:MAG: hypothetical protein Pg6C_14090 [Treponemataceae bacterium]
MMPVKRIGFLMALVFFLCSCDSVVDEYPPFVISGFSIKPGTSQTDYNIAGAEFLFKNYARKDVVKIEMSFRIYYSDGSLPCYGDNKIAVVFSGSVKSGKEEKIIVTLDDNVQIYRDIPFIADQILVGKIFYNDGSVWSDVTGFWQMGGIK